MKRIFIRIKSITALFLAFLFMLPMLAGQTTNAFAADTVTLYHDTQYHYGNWSTGYLSVDDGEGTAFCVQPSKETPPNGSYPYELLPQDSEMRKVLYYLVGGNGYEELTSKSLFSEYDHVDSYVTSHVMLSWMWDGCEWNGDADTGIGNDFKSQIETLYDEIMKLPDPPEAFRAFTIAGQDGYQTVVGSWPLQNVEVSLRKDSAIPEFSKDNQNYSLKGTVYGIYQRKEDAAKDQNAIGKWTVQDDGSSNAVSLNPGTYYYKEIRAGKGYALDPEIHTLEVSASEDMTQTVSTSNVPQYDPVDLLLVKKYIDGKEGESTGDASLSRAEFTVKYYNRESVSGEPKYTWVFQTDNKGRIYYKEDYKTAGPDLIKDASGNPVIPLGMVTIQETKAPAGYLLNETLYTIPITAEGKEEHVDTYQYPVIDEAVIRGGVSFEKHDAELSKSEAMGAASLAGITFSLCNESSQPVLVNGTLFQSGDVIEQFTTDENGHIETSADYLPYGSYSLQETGTNESYLLSDAKKHYFKIRENNVVVSVDQDDQELVFSNQVFRNDISFHKIADQTNKRMGLVAFVLTQNETGEQHVIVTNKNGYYSSKKEHSNQTNINDNVLHDYEKGAVIPSDALKPDTGLWFGKGKNGSVSKPNDSLGALPYGSYTLSELRCEANEGYDLLEDITFYIEEDQLETPMITLGTLTNDKTKTETPQIRTKARDADTGSQLANADERVTIIDEVMFEGLKTGTTYEIEGTIIDQSTNEPLQINGKTITAAKEITPIESKGTAEVSFEFDGTDLAGRDIVVFEKIKQNGGVIAAHEDLSDKGQTIHFPSVKTTVADKGKSGDDTDRVITDTVSYENLIPGETYMIKGTLMDKTSQKAVVKQGEDVTAQIQFVPEHAKGTVEVTFHYDATKYYDKELVVFEELYFEKITDKNMIASHKDLEDAKQTFMIKKPLLKSAENAKPESARNPQTGDTKKSSVYLIAGCAAGGILLLMMKRRKRYTRSR